MTDPIDKCIAWKPVSFRTPNGWWFIAICEACGRTAVSISDGGTASKMLAGLHKYDADGVEYSVGEDEHTVPNL